MTNDNPDAARAPQLLTEALRRALEGNHRDQRGDPVPVVKFFNPLGAGTWLATEIAEDGDALFGIADLGFGCPELGSFSLSELAGLRLPFGLRIERDSMFETNTPLSVWLDIARDAASLSKAEAIIGRFERNP